jgi:transposase
MGQISWRPNAEDLHAAKALLQGIPKLWAKTRLAILMALSNHPEGPHRLIAREARTRTKVVTRFLEGWRASGVRALGQFGRPRELSATILSELRAAIESGSLSSLDEAADWLADKKRAGVRFSRPTVRAYCRELGFDLRPRRRPPKEATGRRRSYRWTAEQSAELRTCASSLGLRATALFKVGTGQKSISEVALECGIEARRLRIDLKYFTGGRLKEMIAHSRSLDILIEKGVQNAFFMWCDNEFELVGKCPSGAAAQTFLESSPCEIRMPRRTVYTHLAKWRKTRGIPARKHRPKVKYKKSEGLRVRSFSQH